MADLPPATGSNDDAGVEPDRGSTRRRPRWVMVFGITLVKLGVIALILVLPFELAISLGAAHGVALLVLLVVAAVTLLVYKLRGRTLHPALLHRPPRGHRFVVDPREAAKRSLAKLTFRVPNERDDAGTTRVEIEFPEDHPIANVLVKPQPGWTYTVERGEPATPVQAHGPVAAHGEQITEVVQRIIWEGGPINPGQFDEFEIYAGPLPEDADQLVFPALQTYSSGEVVRWIEEPAPVLQLVDAADSHGLMTQEAQEDRSPAGRRGYRRLLPIAGSGVAVAAVLAHFGGGAVLMHIGLPAVLVYLGGGAVLAYLGGGALVVGIVAVVVMMPLLVFGARRWLRHR